MSDTVTKELKNLREGQSELQDGQRQLGVLMENIHGNIKSIAEQHGDIKKTQQEHSKTLDQHTEMIGEIKVDVEVLKEDVSELKLDMKEVRSELKHKVDKKDFTSLKAKVALGGI